MSNDLEPYSDNAEARIFNSKVLDQIGIRNKTDKSSAGRPHPKFPDKQVGRHDYLRKYEFFMKQFTCRDAISFLELGAGPDYNIGASAMTWADYFGDSLRLVIADIKESAFNLEKTVPKTDVMVGDLGDIEYLKRLQLFRRYDIILDDASHFWGHQILALETLFDSLNSGGIYIIEDLHTSFQPSLPSKYDSSCNHLTCYGYLQALAEMITGNGKNLCLSEKDEAISLLHNRISREMSRKIDAIVFIAGASIIVKK
jgi:hypothetical protein